MELLTDELRERLPALYETESTDIGDKQVVARFFFPAGVWTWFVVEGEQKNGDFIFFGYVIGDFPEWGYFSLNELQGINVHGLTVERDLHFQPGKFKDVLAKFREE